MRAQEALEGWLESTLELRRLPPRPLFEDGEEVYVNDKLSVALQLRLAREEQGLSQAAVAERAGRLAANPAPSHLHRHRGTP